MTDYNVYMSGSLVRSTAIFTNAAGSPTDPTTITFKYRAGGGSVTTIVYPAAGITKDSQGAYHSDVDTSGWTGPGNQLYTTEWIGTGTVQAPGADYWEVEPLAI